MTPIVVKGDFHSIQGETSRPKKLGRWIGMDGKLKHLYVESKVYKTVNGAQKKMVCACGLEVKDDLYKVQSMYLPELMAGDTSCEACRRELRRRLIESGKWQEYLQAHHAKRPRAKKPKTGLEKGEKAWYDC